MTDLLQGFLLLAVGFAVLFMGFYTLGDGQLAVGAEAFWNDLTPTQRQALPRFNDPPAFNFVGIFWQDGFANSVFFYFMNQGIILQKIDRLGESRALLEKGLRLAVSLGDRMRQTRLNLAMGRLETLAGRLAKAEELILEGKALADQNRFMRECTIADEYLGDILLAQPETGAYVETGVEAPPFSLAMLGGDAPAFTLLGLNQF